MGLVRVALAALFLAAIANADECSEFKDDCNDGADKGRMVKIICDDPAGKCRCEGSTENGGVNTVPCGDIQGSHYSDITHAAMNSTGCKSLCTTLETSTSIVCKYYKWEEARSTRSCALMSEAQCTAGDNGFCGNDHCESDGIDCGSGPLPPDPPVGSTCNMTLPVHNQYNLMWSCYDPFSHDDQKLDVYGSQDEQTVPVRTICKTVQP